jgi:hypothetical protein
MELMKPQKQQRWVHSKQFINMAVCYWVNTSDNFLLLPGP